ncbi:MAG: phytanoyl-CoA dioxygenase family protein [Alphaproteobacteria bacterium]
MIAGPGCGKAAPSLDRDGYAVLPDLFDAAAVTALRAELARLCRGGVAGTSGTSGDTDDTELLAKFVCLQFPHVVSPLVQRTLLHRAIVDELRRVLGPALKLMQSIVLMRRAGTPGQAWHQDRHYLDSGDNPLVGAWVALDDVRVDNGCIWILPASHRPARVWPHRLHGDPEYDASPRAVDHPFDEGSAVALEAGAGTCVLFDGHVLHRSLANRRPTGLRRALIGHFSAAGTPSVWDGGNREIDLDGGCQVEVAMGARAYAHQE